MDKKTNFPDLERLPPHNHFKHFLDWVITKPRMIIENYIIQGPLSHDYLLILIFITKF